MGIIRALNEAGIPVDMIGGTSIGAFMAALYAEERSYTQMRIKARQWAMVRGFHSLRVPIRMGVHWLSIRQLK